MVELQAENGYDMKKFTRFYDTSARQFRICGRQYLSETQEDQSYSNQVWSGRAIMQCVSVVIITVNHQFSYVSSSWANISVKQPFSAVR